MPTNYPTSLDSLTNPTSSDPQNNPSHSGQHANANDAIEAIETFLGTSSAPLPTILDTDVTLAANSDVKIASQKATKTYADTKTTLSTVQQDVTTNYGISRQAIMNGNFDVWQRGTTKTNGFSPSFLADRWGNYIDATVANVTISRQLLTSGDIPNAFYFQRIAPDAAGTFGASTQCVHYQSIENGTRNLCGLNKKVTISLWARSSITNKKLGIQIVQNYGTGGSPTAQETIAGQVQTLTSTWTKYTFTFTTNTLVGKTFGTNGDDFLQFRFWTGWGSTTGATNGLGSAETFVGAGNIDIAQVQLCSGDVALPFNPKSYEEELRACQRYYETGNDACSCYVSSGQTYYKYISFKVSKRTNSTFSTTDASNNNFPAGNPAVEAQTTNDFRVYKISNGTGQGNYIFSWKADSEL